jgi:alpha-tubulin suppressor-like RCC1 family protein/uncharacterized protein YjdB
MRRAPLLVALLGLVIACDDEETGEELTGIDRAYVARVVVSPVLDTIFAPDTIRAGDRIQLSATAIGYTGQEVTPRSKVVWTSSDPAVATVNENGLVNARTFGTVTVKVLAGKEGAATIVVAPAMQRVTIAPSGAQTILVDEPIAARDTLRLTASAFDAQNAPLTGVSYSWLSQSPAVVTVSATGTVKAVSLGTSNVSARASNGSAGSSPVTVQPIIASVDLTSPVTRALQGDTVQLSARALGYAGEAMARTFTWSTTNPAVATVDQSGRVALVGAGAARVVARTAWRADTVNIDVLSRTLVSIEAGDDFTCGVANLGRGYCWGRSEAGQIGSAADSSCFGSPEDGRFASAPCTLLPKQLAGPALEFKTIDVGADFACGVTTARRLYCWGNDGFGQMGNGQTGGGQIPNLATVNQVQFDTVAVGGGHACALAAGIAYCWGADGQGQLGDRKVVNSTTPIPVFGSLVFRSITAGGAHTCALTAAGAAYCWGDNSRGQLGIGSSNDMSTTPVAVSGGPFSSISAGIAHTCAIATGAGAVCWGSNTRGELGVGALVSEIRTTPTAVTGGQSFVAISAGGACHWVGNACNPAEEGVDTPPALLRDSVTAHTCALDAAGNAFCWGDGEWQQTGASAPSSVPSTTPVALSGAPALRSITAGGRHSCGRGTDDRMYCWGSNNFGALGTGLQAAPRGSPQEVLKPR